MKPEYAIYTKPGAILGCGDVKIYRKDWQYEVRIMAIAEGWAMVRRKGKMPFVCWAGDLTRKEPTA